MGVIAPFGGAARRTAEDEQGQMTVEMAVAFPVLIVVALIAVNACTFIYQSAIFDRVLHESVRVYATAPAYGQGPLDACGRVEQALAGQLSADNLDIDVACSEASIGLYEFQATLRYHPTLFGLGMRSEVFGVALPSLVHTSSYVVESYRPGVFV